MVNEETWEYGSFSVLRENGEVVYMRMAVPDPNIEYIWYVATDEGFSAHIPDGKCKELEKKYQESKQ